MRYFFNIGTEDSLLVDEHGDEFANIDQAFEHAKVTVEELELEFPRDAKNARFVLVALEVTDQAGTEMFRLPIHQCTCR